MERGLLNTRSRRSRTPVPPLAGLMRSGNCVLKLSQPLARVPALFGPTIRGPATDDLCLVAATASTQWPVLSVRDDPLPDCSLSFQTRVRADETLLVRTGQSNCGPNCDSGPRAHENRPGPCAYAREMRQADFNAGTRGRGSGDRCRSG